MYMYMFCFVLLWVLNTEYPLSEVKLYYFENGTSVEKGASIRTLFFNRYIYIYLHTQSHLSLSHLCLTRLTVALYAYNYMYSNLNGRACRIWTQLEFKLTVSCFTS